MIVFADYRVFTPIPMPVCEYGVEDDNTTYPNGSIILIQELPQWSTVHTVTIDSSQPGITFRASVVVNNGDDVYVLTESKVLTTSVEGEQELDLWPYYLWTSHIGTHHLGLRVFGRLPVRPCVDPRDDNRQVFLTPSILKTGHTHRVNVKYFQSEKIDVNISMVVFKYGVTELSSEGKECSYPIWDVRRTNYLTTKSEFRSDRCTQWNWTMSAPTESILCHTVNGSVTCNGTDTTWIEPRTAQFSRVRMDWAGTVTVDICCDSRCYDTSGTLCIYGKPLARITRLSDRSNSLVCETRSTSRPTELVQQLDEMTYHWTVSRPGLVPKGWASRTISVPHTDDNEFIRLECQVKGMSVQISDVAVVTANLKEFASFLDNAHCLMYPDESHTSQNIQLTLPGDWRQQKCDQRQLSFRVQETGVLTDHKVICIGEGNDTHADCSKGTTTWEWIIPSILRVTDMDKSTTGIYDVQMSCDSSSLYLPRMCVYDYPTSPKIFQTFVDVDVKYTCTSAPTSVNKKIEMTYEWIIDGEHAKPGDEAVSPVQVHGQNGEILLIKPQAHDSVQNITCIAKERGSNVFRVIYKIVNESDSSRIILSAVTGVLGMIFILILFWLWHTKRTMKHSKVDIEMTEFRSADVPQSRRQLRTLNQEQVGTELNETPVEAVYRRQSANYLAIEDAAVLTNIEFTPKLPLRDVTYSRPIEDTMTSDRQPDQGTSGLVITAEIHQSYGGSSEDGGMSTQTGDPDNNSIESHDVRQYEEPGTGNEYLFLLNEDSVSDEEGDDGENNVSGDTYNETVILQELGMEGNDMFLLTDADEGINAVDGDDSGGFYDETLPPVYPPQSNVNVIENGSGKRGNTEGDDYLPLIRNTVGEVGLQLQREPMSQPSYEKLTRELLADRNEAGSYSADYLTTDFPVHLGLVDDESTGSDSADYLTNDFPVYLALVGDNPPRVASFGSDFLPSSLGEYLSFTDDEVSGSFSPDQLTNDFPLNLELTNEEAAGSDSEDYLITDFPIYLSLIGDDLAGSETADYLTTDFPVYLSLVDDEPNCPGPAGHLTANSQEGLMFEGDEAAGAAPSNFSFTALDFPEECPRAIEDYVQMQTMDLINELHWLTKEKCSLTVKYRSLKKMLLMEMSPKN